MARSRIIGAPEARRKFGLLPGIVRKALVRGIEAGALDAATAAKKLIQRKHATGKWYPRHQVDDVWYAAHRASAPGEPPATDTGRLAASIHHEVDKVLLEAVVVTDVEYAPTLEFGTMGMAKRPFFLPAFNMTIEKSQRRIANIIERVSRKV